MRLDQYVADKHPSLSRSYVAKLIDAGDVLVNDEAKKPGYKLRHTDDIAMNFDVEQMQQIEDIDLPVIYEDANVLVVNKPVGVISHSRGKYWYEPSVASFVRQKTKQPGERAGIVHRLDRATSGVMVCSKNQATLSMLQKQFSERQVKKVYRAIVAGHLKHEQAVIDMPIERNPKAPATFRVGPNGKTAQTAYKVIAQSEQYDEVELTPATGRTHQLRVHLAHQGHPILGDEFYNGESADRLYLHAYKITLSIPDKGEQTFEAPLPTAFAEKLGDA